MDDIKPKPIDIHEDVDIWTNPLDTMTYEEWCDLCSRIIDCYNKKHKDVDGGNNNGCN